MFKHGADLEKIRRKFDIKGEVLDFSSNVNPFIPENTIINISDNINDLKRYPDIEYIDLRNEIAEHISDSNTSNKFTHKNICVGNGSTELIYLILEVIGGKVGIISPTFSEYKRAAKILKKDFVEIQLDMVDGSFEYPDLNRDDKIDYKDLDVIVICNPNNPDGRLRNIGDIVDFCEKNDIKLVVDETFIEFSYDYMMYTAANYKYKNIFIIRAITKFYGMPGIRLGYLASKNAKVIDEMYDIKLPWTVNSIAVGLGMEIFKDKKFSEMTRRFYSEERDYMYAELCKIKNITVFNSDAAFFLIKIDDKFPINSTQLKDRLILENNILIRDAGNFVGLNDRFFRIAIKRREDNIVIIESLKKIFG